MKHFNRPVALSGSKTIRSRENTEVALSVNAADTDTLSLDLAPKEMLAAYLVHEPYVEPMLRLLLDMSEEQRRISLAMMQCIALGHGGGARKAE